MSVGVVIVTHGKTGESLLDEAAFILGEIPSNIFAVAFNQAGGVNSSLGLISSSIQQADSGDGVLVLTDLIGASPCNQVADMLDEFHAVMVTGANLSMLICACNYRSNTLEMVVRKVVQSGKRSVKIFQK
jgi:PTS system ascorbate-specific IIA component